MPYLQDVSWSASDNTPSDTDALTLAVTVVFLGAAAPVACSELQS